MCNVRVIWSLLLFAAAPVWAHDGAVSVLIENDFFTGSDSNYTNGIGISWSSDDVARYDAESVVHRWASFWSFLPGIAGANSTHVSWTLAQEMHTPDDITNPTPSPDDTPYAGVLYLDNVLYSIHDDWGQAWHLRVGLVGPSSHADSTQRRFHKWIGVDKPEGWSTQMPDEPIVNVGYSISGTMVESSFGRTGSWRVMPLLSAEAGNYTTAVGFGFLAEVGWNVPTSLPSSSLRNGLDTANAVAAGPQREWSVSFYAGVGGYAVAHYLPFDGTVFKNSRSVESDSLASMVSGGLSIRKEAFVVSLGVSYLNSSFRNVRDGLDFGTLSVVWYP